MGLKPLLWDQLFNQLDQRVLQRLTNQLVQMLLLKGAVTFVLPTSAYATAYPQMKVAFPR